MTEASNTRGYRMLRRIFAALTLTALVAVATPGLVAADAWASGIRSCFSTESCKVTSQATGGVQHKRCATDYTNCVLKGSWSNGGSYVWRTTWHGSGSQTALISTNLVLAQQSATCVCVQTPCPLSDLP